RKWQDQHFEIKACAIDGVAGYPGNGTCRITRHRSEQVDDLSAACLTPQAGKRLTFELAAEQRTDARAGEPKPMLVHEIGREHERVAQYLPDRDRIDVLALGGGTFSAHLIPVSKQRAGRGMFHRATCSTARRCRAVNVPDRDICDG